MADNLRALRLLLAAAEGGAALRTVWLSALSQLRELQLHAWALALAREGLARLGPDPQLLLQLLLVLDALASSSGAELLNADQAAALRRQIEARLADCAPVEQAEIRLGLASHQMGQGLLDDALASFEQAMAIVQQPGEVTPEEREKRQKLVDVNSWNFGITLLKRQQFERGWRLFEYGLRTPAEGPQRWQRALRKPFSSAELPLWRGESIAGKRLLLLEEQAIGDVMMFVTLLPALLEEVASIGLLLADRLLPIYRRSLQHLADRVQIWSFADASEGRLSPAHYDLQCPIGSICQHRFTDLERYGQHLPLLQAKPQWAKQLRRDYLQHGSPAQQLIGISWRGGGKGLRIQQKSILPEQYAQLLQPLPGVRFVSLQYGNAGPTVEHWRQQGLDVLHDSRVDPLKQMDPWLAQVAACDAVLSVANTTIHGAGGLGLPTLCLLSVHSDWRWLDDPSANRSYWYPSVGIARESREAGWGEALQQARAWLEAGSPPPTLG
ncbi:hypothetical protein KBY57_13060 [Cyanobium sp. Aljojuca 7D2]|uniref:hypothetical protein n=1 Tax=Cyanobium sp. Aljojuca 7D2 TaxID=2823698 RepID=UPI0020CD25EE|nr:hypothetical protein [Cyanobium sp. Aljojuca 7D2]MCP9891974.1 hypothetical protein [Cyanobium sp. Aljojuca 7D2]